MNRGHTYSEHTVDADMQCLLLLCFLCGQGGGNDDGDEDGDEEGDEGEEEGYEEAEPGVEVILVSARPCAHRHPPHVSVDRAACWAPLLTWHCC